MRVYRLAVLALCPVQYQIPIWSLLGKHPQIDLTVYYLAKSLKGWEMPLRDGYEHKFLKNLLPEKGEVVNPFNPGVIPEIIHGKYDAILLHGYQSPSMTLGLLCAKFSRTPVIMRGESVLTKPRTRWLKHIKSFVLPRLFSLCDVVLYSCTGNRLYYEHYGVPPHKMDLIPVAVDNDRFQAESRELAQDADKFRAEIGVPSDHLLVLCAAQLRPWKRQIDLLYALKILQDWGVDNVSVVFVGQGSEYERMSQYIKDHNLDNAHLLGFQEHNSISKFYSIADVGTIVSEYDPSPKAMNEMMNFKLPIICTNTVGSAPDLVHEGENGFIIEVGDALTLADHLRRLANDRDLVERMGQKSLEIVSEWNIESDVEALVRAVKRVSSLRASRLSN